MPCRAELQPRATDTARRAGSAHGRPPGDMQATTAQELTAMDPMTGTILVMLVGIVIVLGMTVLLFMFWKGRPFADGDVFGASRLSRGNRLFPTQVLITPTERRALHAAVDRAAASTRSTWRTSHRCGSTRNLFFSDVLHRDDRRRQPDPLPRATGRATRSQMKRLIEQLPVGVLPRRPRRPGPAACGLSRIVPIRSGWWTNSCTRHGAVRDRVHAPPKGRATSRRVSARSSSRRCAPASSAS